MNQKKPTLEEILTIPQEMLTVTTVAKYMGIDPDYLRKLAREKPEKLGFPVVISDNGSVQIPKEGFVYFIIHGYFGKSPIQPENENEKAAEVIKRVSTMTLADIEAYPKNLLTAAVVGQYLNIDPMYIRHQARKAPEKLGFPVMTYGKCSVRIPKEAFINYIRGTKTPPDNTKGKSDDNNDK